LALSPALTIVLGFVIYEHRTSHIEKKQVSLLFALHCFFLEGTYTTSIYLDP